MAEKCTIKLVRPFEKIDIAEITLCHGEALQASQRIAELLIGTECIWSLSLTLSACGMLKDRS